MFDEYYLRLSAAMHKRVAQKAQAWIDNIPTDNADKVLNNDPKYIEYCTQRFGGVPSEVSEAIYESYLVDELNNPSLDQQTKEALYNIYLTMLENMHKRNQTSH